MNQARDRDVSEAIWEIRDLLKLLAEPAVAARDAKQREALRSIVGASGQKAKAAMLMDGTRSQAEIHKQSGCNKGHLSTMVKHLGEAELLKGDTKLPQLSINLPEDFFKGSE